MYSKLSVDAIQKFAQFSCELSFLRKIKGTFSGSD